MPATRERSGAVHVVMGDQIAEMLDAIVEHQRTLVKNPSKTEVIKSLIVNEFWRIREKTGKYSKKD